MPAKKMTPAKEATPHEALLDRLKAEQRTLLDVAARSTLLPSAGALQKIAHLEIAIGALETRLDELAVP